MVGEEVGYAALAQAAHDASKVGGLTHGFYRYPARFGEAFVREAVNKFTAPGDLVIDPFCGGGTTIVEALSRGRRALGSDVSPLALFVTRIKTTPLSERQLDVVDDWVAAQVSSVRGLMAPNPCSSDHRLVGLNQPFRNILCNLKQGLELLPRGATRDFAAGVLLKTAQWAFDGKEQLPTPTRFAHELCLSFDVMRLGMEQFKRAIGIASVDKRQVSANRRLVRTPAKKLGDVIGHCADGAALAITSPPYLGVHVLYNKWQLAGRRELRAAFYLSDCEDIGGAADYTIVDRRSKSQHRYFAEIRDSFSSVCRLLRNDGRVIQLVSFASAEVSMPLYLGAMADAGFDECETYVRVGAGHQWRNVPGRRWYARVKAVADSSASREVLLVHKKRG